MPNSISVKDSGNNNVTIATIDALINNSYETVAASSTNQVLGSTGATGDLISHLVIIPATVSPGAVAVIDNATSITVFTGGSNSISNLIPFVIPLNMISASGAWKVTTGTAVSVIAVGKFT